jgi:uncharacterized membrane protein YhhN
MFTPAALLTILGVAILDWFAVGFNWHKAKYITKPLVMIVLIGWLSLMGGWRYPAMFFMLGAVFSLLGDVWLMMPGKFFLAGLASFLIAHIFYIVGFGIHIQQVSMLFFLISGLIIIITTFMIHRIRQGVYRTTGARRLRWSVTIYGVVITCMFLSALQTLGKSDWDINHYIPVAIGGLLFYASDTLLAYDRFVAPIKYGRLLVRITYHLGQILLLGGAVSHFVK